MIDGRKESDSFLNGKFVKMICKKVIRGGEQVWKVDGKTDGQRKRIYKECNTHKK